MEDERSSRPLAAAKTPRRASSAAGPGSALDVAVLLGGPSAEREVSFKSGRAIASALRRLGHRVKEADISPADTSALDERPIDAVFIALHGEFGESGDVQDLCEQRGLAYTGSGPAASRLAMDKAAAKQLFRGAGLATPDWAVLEDEQSLAERAGLLAGVGVPAVIKPITGGSSVDVVIARGEAERDLALEDLLDKYGRILVERFIAGRELTVGILGGSTLPVLEIIPAGESYDWHAKYDDDAGTRYQFDHGLPAEAVAANEDSARRAFACLGCRDMGRADYILDSAGRAWLLEMNTIPGFTDHSLLPKAAARAGISFDRLVGRILELAVARSRMANRQAEDGR